MGEGGEIDSWDYGGIENIGSNYRSSTWLECLKSVDQLKKKG